MAGRKCSICTHKQVSQINKKLVEGVSLRNISQNYKMDVASVHRHVNNCLKVDLQAVQEARKTEQAFDFATELQKLYIKANKMVFALEKWLSDPENDEEYDIGPRDSEITLIAHDWNKMFMGKPTRVKVKLGDVLKALRKDAKLETLAIQSAAMDNRKLYLEAFKTLTDRLEQMAKFYGLYTKEKKNPQDIEDTATVIIERLKQKGWDEDKARDWINRNPDITQVAGTH